MNNRGMKNTLSMLAYLTLLLCLSSAAAPASKAEGDQEGGASTLLQFDSEQQRLRYQQLLWELRCPKCQNQNLVDSDADLAGDLRREIYRLVIAGESNESIVGRMESRYGEFIRYAPPLDRYTAVLWGLPLLLLLIAALIVAAVARRYQAGEDCDGTDEVENRAGRDDND